MPVGDCVTDGALILKTTNGGIDWVKQPSVTNTYFLKSVFFVNADIGYVISFDHIYKTTNGGTDWFEQFREQTIGLIPSIPLMRIQAMW